MFDYEEITQRLVLGDNARWPLPRLRGLAPVVLGEHVCGARLAVDLGYRGLPGELFVPVLAVQSGDVSAAICTSHGFAITLDHGGWATHYAQLTKMFVAPQLPAHRWHRQRVNAGEIIGYASTSTPHLRFEVWRRNELGDVAVDPFTHMKAWTVSNDAGAF